MKGSCQLPAWIPPALAYGDAARGRPGLIFDVELRSVSAGAQAQ